LINELVAIFNFAIDMPLKVCVYVHFFPFVLPHTHKCVASPHICSDSIEQIEKRGSSLDETYLGSKDRYRFAVIRITVLFVRDPTLSIMHRSGYMSMNSSST